MATYTGTNGSDTINGSNGDDTINSGNGSDTVDGGDGNDTIDGGNGDDTLDGEDGNDTIYGGNGRDVIHGGAGNDILIGENGDDRITGGGGDDLIDGNNGFDIAYYTGSISEYTFAYSAGYLHIIHLGGAGANGHDRVIRVERLVFGDRIVNLGGGNDNAPVAIDDHVSITEDSGTYSSGTGSVKDNDFDFEAEPLTVTPGTFTGTYGTLTLNADGTYTYTLFASAQILAQGQIVQDSFNYTVTAGTKSDTGTLVFNIGGLNDAPTAAADTASGTENQVLAVDVLANDADIDNGAVLTVTAASAPAGQGSASVVGNQVQFDPGGDFDDLAAGETENVTVTYTIMDEHGATASAAIAITVTGTNDAPVATDDNAVTNEETSVSGNVLGNDSDVEGETLVVANPGSYVGSYGTLILAADGSFTYVPSAAAQGLDDGETANDVFAYTASDGSDFDGATLTVTVTGVNDAPVASDDTAATTEDGSASGNVLANDSDVDGETLIVANPGTYLGSNGTLVLAADGSYTYTPYPAAEGLDDGELAGDVFSYVASDGTASDNATLTITIAGLNDAPVANDDAAATSEDFGVSGNVLANDSDIDVEPLSVANPGIYVGSYGSLTLAADGSYSYAPGAAADGLAAGETANDVFAYTASDGTASDSATLTVTVTGTNDAPTIDAGNTDASGSVTELADGDPGENVAIHTDSGAVAFDDLDLSDTHSASATPQGVSYLGTFTLDPVDQIGDSVGWDFSVSDAAIEGLDEGEVLVQTYAIEIDDGHGGIATQNVTITITGAGDGPQTVWYIDNSAIGSSNIGTAANPFTSIASFNAAQGTPAGPQAGHTVFLLAGTGTYVEADGINLLDDQSLIGVSDGALRPTIVTTGGANHGIELAQDNTVSGVDIGNTTGAGISDGGGSVGTLVIGDVDIGGARLGQIIDIDQGGLATITLNSAASTGSTGGAIDLAGLAGDFTVSGATTITGVHAGGGVSVTGSSALVSLTGGGLISTGASTAINYVGNSGGLVLDGGFDIVTTSGAGLSASGGGTVTATGAGNSIVSAGGVALSVVNTGIGGDGLGFDSISANGGTNGIVLTNTGNLAGLHIFGDGGGANNGSGGTIQNMTGDGILLTGTEDFRIAYVNVSNNGGDGIGGSGVNGFRLDRVNISGNGNNSATNESGINLASLTGSGSAGARATAIVNSVISNNFEFEIQIVNTSGTLTNLQLVNSIVSSTGAGGTHGNLVNFLGSGTAVMGLTVTGSTFDGSIAAGALTGTALQVDSAGGTVLAEVATSTFVENNAGLQMSSSGSGNVTFAIHDNNINFSRSNGVTISTANLGTGTMNGTIADNIIGMQGVAGSGSIIGRGINVATAGGGAANLLIDGNTVQSITSLEGISVVDNLTPGIVNVTITDNILRDIVNRGLNVQTTGTGTLNSTIAGNQFIAVTGVGGTVLRVNEGAGTTLNVTQLAPTAAADPNELDDANGIAHTAVSIAGTPQFGQPAPALPGPPSLPMMTASDAPDGQAARISAEDLEGIVASAIQHWADAGASASQLATMSQITFTIADLAGRTLGISSPGHITIDSDGGGFGWFVDDTPNDAEYGSSGADLVAAPGTEEAGKIDLLTVVMHELGHTIGLNNESGFGNLSALMFETIDPGERRLPDETFLADVGQIPIGLVEWGMLALLHEVEILA